MAFLVGRLQEVVLAEDPTFDNVTDAHNYALSQALDDIPPYGIWEEVGGSDSEEWELQAIAFQQAIYVWHYGVDQ